MANAAIIAACAAAASRNRNKSAEPMYFEYYAQKYRPQYRGYISIESNVHTEVIHNVSCKGVDIKFDSFTEVDKLIRKLTKLRDDMIEKEFGGTK